MMCHGDLCTTHYQKLHVYIRKSILIIKKFSLEVFLKDLYLNMYIAKFCGVVDSHEDHMHSIQLKVRMWLLVQGCLLENCFSNRIAVVRMMVHM